MGLFKSVVFIDMSNSNYSLGDAADGADERGAVDWGMCVARATCKLLNTLISTPAILLPSAPGP